MKRILSVTFEIDAQNWIDGRFSVLQDVCDALGLGPGEDIHLVVKDHLGTSLYNGIQRLRSGTEVYGDAIRACIQAGQSIRVTASRP